MVGAYDVVGDNILVYTVQILITHSPGGGLRLCIMKHYA